MVRRTTVGSGKIAAPMPQGRSSTAYSGPAAERSRAERGNRVGIVRAAAKAIARNGVRGMRVEEVAAEAGVSPALLYYHFSNREGLVRAALEYASEKAPSTALAEPAASGDGFEALEAALLGEIGDEPEVREAAVVWARSAPRRSSTPSFATPYGASTRTGAGTSPTASAPALPTGRSTRRSTPTRPPTC